MALATAYCQSCSMVDRKDLPAWIGRGLGKWRRQYLGQVVGHGQEDKELKVFTSIK